MKKAIDLWAHAGEILETVGKGVLLTTKVGDRVNTMTIGWGTLGIEWKTPIFTAFVRESRLTREFLDKNPEFTVNIPVVGDVKEILGVCGTRSGRDMDKIAQLGLHLEEPEHISVPGIRELPDCRSRCERARRTALRHSGRRHSPHCLLRADSGSIHY